MLRSKPIIIRETRTVLPSQYRCVECVKEDLNKNIRQTFSFAKELTGTASCGPSLLSVNKLEKRKFMLPYLCDSILPSSTASSSPGPYSFPNCARSLIRRSVLAVEDRWCHSKDPRHTCPGNSTGHRTCLLPVWHRLDSSCRPLEQCRRDTEVGTVAEGSSGPSHRADTEVLTLPRSNLSDPQTKAFWIGLPLQRRVEVLDMTGSVSGTMLLTATGPSRSKQTAS